MRQFLQVQERVMLAYFAGGGAVGTSLSCAPAPVSAPAPVPVRRACRHPYPRLRLCLRL